MYLTYDVTVVFDMESPIFDLTNSPDEDEIFLEHPYRNGNKLPDRNTGPYLSPMLSRSESKLKRKNSLNKGVESEEFLNSLPGSDPLRLELVRLENEVRDKDREISELQAEIKASRVQERNKQRAFEDVSDAKQKVEEKLKQSEQLLENKNLELKKINDEKKAALAAQFAAEATLRRVHAAQKDDDMPPIEAILAPLEAELKISRQDMAKLQETNRALDRLTKSKEAALLDAERTVQIAEIKASMVDDLQNRNQELMKQIEICQEENKIVDKMHRQKVAEVEKLSLAVAELEEAVLAGGDAVNAVRERQRQVKKLLEEKRTLERELARTKVSANRVASVVANEWKDASDKVMPVKKWLDERRFLQGEMQQLREKLSIAERAAKTEAQLKEKFQLRLKVLEDSLKGLQNGVSRRILTVGEENLTANICSRRQSICGVENALRTAANRRRTSSSHIKSSASNSFMLQNMKLTSRSLDGGRPDGSISRNKFLLNGLEDLENKIASPSVEEMASTSINTARKIDYKTEVTEGTEDTVSSLLYDMLQKEVIALRKASHEKDQSLKDKDDAIEMLAKKVDTLTKAMDVEAKKMRRDMANMEKKVAAAIQVDHSRRQGNPRGSLNVPQPNPGR